MTEGRTQIPPTSRFEARSRWSLASRCARAGAYALRGAEPDPVDEIMEGYFRRGKQLQQDVAASYIERYGAEQIVEEKAIAWPAGVAHGDIFVKPEKLAVEVKSTASWVPTDYHLLQLAGEVLFDAEAEHGALILVHPSNLTRRVIPMPVVPEALEKQVWDIVADVTRCADTREPLPARPCERPSDAISRGCPFVGTCFADWTPPAPIEIHEDAAALAAELLEVDSEVKAAEAEVEQRKAVRAELRARFKHLVEPAREYVTDDLQVRVTQVKGRTTYDVATAVKLGVVDAEALEPFTKVGVGHDRWSVRLRPEDVAPTTLGSLSQLAAEDFGDEAPWVDADLDVRPEGLL